MKGTPRTMCSKRVTISHGKRPQGWKNQRKTALKSQFADSLSFKRWAQSVQIIGKLEYLCLMVNWNVRTNTCRRTAPTSRRRSRGTLRQPMQNQVKAMTSDIASISSISWKIASLDIKKHHSSYSLNGERNLDM